MSASYTQTAAFYSRKRDQQFRTLLRREHGAGKFRVTKSGAVHAYGKMPNTNTIGWWLLGDIASVQQSYGL
jgi:hypothetical protein